MKQVEESIGEGGEASQGGWWGWGCLATWSWSAKHPRLCLWRVWGGENASAIRTSSELFIYWPGARGGP